MKKLKYIFESVIGIFETIFLLFVLVFGYPFYKKSLKEIWGIIKTAREERNKY